MRQFASERFAVTLGRSSCLNYLHRLGFSFKRPKKRLLKAKESLREAFVAEYGALMEEAQRTGAKVFFADEDHFRADAELRGKWVLKGEPALVDSTGPSYGEKASYYSAVCLETAEVEWMDASAGSAGGQQQQQQRNVGRVPFGYRVWGVRGSHDERMSRRRQTLPRKAEPVSSSIKLSYESNIYNSGEYHQDW